MRKLVFTLFVFVLSMGFMACEQEEINPSEPLIEPIETMDPGLEGGGEESGGVKN